MHNNQKIIFVAFNDNTLARRIIKLLIDNNIIPIHAFMASENALKAFRKNSIKRYFRQNGFANTIWRIFYRLTLRKELKNESLYMATFLKMPLKEVLALNNISIGDYKLNNFKTIYF